MKIFFSSEKILFCENKKNQTINKDSTKLYFNTPKKLTNIFGISNWILKIFYESETPKIVTFSSKKITGITMFPTSFGH